MPVRLFGDVPAARFTVVERDTVTPGASASAAGPPRRRLESWKAIAAHFGRDVTTVRRWERREGLPIHRLFHEKLGSIYAFTDELDAWWAARKGAAAAPAVPDDDPGPGAGLWNRGVIGTAAALTAIAMVLAVTQGPDAWRSWRERSRGAVAAPASVAIPGVAVLPLVDVAGSPGEPYFADGMTTAIIAELAALESLKVIANTSVKRYRGHTKQPVSVIAHELGVHWIVQGSVERIGDRVRITVGLHRSDGERPVWSETFEQPVAAILEMQAEIAQAVHAQVLGPDASRRPRRGLPRASPVNLAAYELYLRGEFHVEQLNPVSLARAVEYFTQAVAADPDLAVAWAGLAKAEFLQESWGNARHGERAGAARHATLKALALDPDLAAAHDMMGRMFVLYDRDWSGADTAFRKAIAEAPSFAVAYNGYSILLQALARNDEAVAAAAKARELDPMAPWAWSEEGRALFRARRFAEAEARYKRALDLDPGFGPAIDRLAHLYLFERRVAEARDAIARLERLPSSRRDGHLVLRAWLDVVEGKPAGARSPIGPIRWTLPVLVAAGEHDAALAELERGAADGTLPGFALGNPELDPLRRDPRFARIVARLGLPVDRFVALGPRTAQ